MNRIQDIYFQGLLYLLLLHSFGCSDDPDFEPPLVQTGFVNEITAEGARLNGRVVYEGTGTSSVGFVWDVTGQPVIDKSSKVVLAQVEKGVITFDVTFDLKIDQKYYVRAFGLSNGKVIYGDTVSFKSLGSLPPTIDSFLPTSGKKGTIIKVTGHNFSGQILNNKVKLGGVSVLVLEASPAELTIKIPETFPLSGKLKLSVEVASRIAISTDYFTMEGSSITNVQPKEAIGGDTLRLYGTDFAAQVNNNTVKLNDMVCKVILASATYVEAIIPYNINSGAYTVSITANSTTSIATEIITIYSPWIPTSRIGLGLPESDRAYAVAFVINNEAYYGTGFNEYLYPQQLGFGDFWKYSSTTNSWTKMAAFPGEVRYGAVGFSIGNKGYVGMGNQPSTQPYTDMWQYDAMTNQWKKLSDFPGEARSFALTFVINGKAYVGMGGNNLLSNPYLLDFWEYDPTNDTWKALNNFPGTARGAGYVSFVSGGKGYYGLGVSTREFTYGLKDFWEYNPITDTWLQKSDFVVNDYRYLCTSASVKGKAYIMGGYASSGIELKECWEYNFKADTWNRRMDLSHTLYAASSFSLNNQIFLVGGFSKKGVYNQDMFTYTISK